MTDKPVFEFKGLSRKTKTNPPMILIYADAGFGKSNLAVSSPSPLYMQLEDSAVSFDVATPENKIDSFDRVKTFIQYTIDGFHQCKSAGQEWPFETFIVDSCTDVIKLAMDDILEKTGTPMSDHAYGKGSVMLRERLSQWLDLLNKLRKETGMVIINTAHTVVDSEEDTDGTQAARRRPHLEYGKGNKNDIGKAIEAMHDIIAYGELLVTKENVSGDDKNRRRVLSGGKTRILRLDSNPRYVAKFRTEGGVKAPAFIQLPDITEDGVTSDILWNVLGQHIPFYANRGDK